MSMEELEVLVARGTKLWMKDELADRNKKKI